MAPYRRSSRIEELQKKKAQEKEEEELAKQKATNKRKKKALTVDLLSLPPAGVSHGRIEKKQQTRRADPLFSFRKYKSSFPADISRLLASVYFDPTKLGSYGSTEQLYRNAVELYPDAGISDQLVRDWLSINRTRALTKRRKRKFFRRKTIVSGIGKQYQADLMDMALYRSHAKGSSADSDQVLVVIDCFSRKAAAVPILSKHGESVVAGFRLIFESRMLPVPQKIQTDEGGEFFNKVCDRFFKSLNIIHFAAYQEMKAPIVERFIRTLRDKLRRYSIGENTTQYKEVLPFFVANYNRSPHRSLAGFAPVDVNKDNEGFVFAIQYAAHLAAAIPSPKLAVGDVVRAAIISPKSLKKSRKTFHDELFVVSYVKPTNPPTYLISTVKDNTPVLGAYYEEQLQKLPGT